MRATSRIGWGMRVSRVRRFVGFLVRPGCFMLYGSRNGRRRLVESRSGRRMDGIFHELSRKTDPAKLLGYLNFSDGRPDPRFQKGLSDAFAHLLEGGDTAPWFTLPRWLTHELSNLVESGSPA